MPKPLLFESSGVATTTFIANSNIKETMIRKLQWLQNMAFEQVRNPALSANSHDTKAM